MSLELPPTRPLPDPDRIVDSILDDELTLRRRSPRRFAGVVAAAVVLILVAVGFVVLSSRDQPQVADPPVSPSISRAPTPTPPGPSAGGPVHLEPHELGSGVVFDHSAVTLTDARWSRGEGLDVEAEVCVLSLSPDQTGKTTRISWDSWTVGGQGPATRRELGSKQTPFPRDTSAKVGQCVTGWISFAGTTKSQPSMTEVDYTDQLGDHASWRADPSAAFKVGRTIELPYVSVTLSTAARIGKVYVVSVRTCVRALPPQTPTSDVVLREDAWTVGTDNTRVTINDPLDGVPPLPTTFPASRRASVGQCVSGFIPFGTGATPTVDAVFYRDAYGQSASWRLDR